MADTQTQETAQTQETQKVVLAENLKEFKFTFHTDKIKDSDGKEIAQGRKHPEVKHIFEVPTRQDVVNILASNPAEDKTVQLIMELIHDVVYQQARAQINAFREEAGLDKDFTVDKFDLASLSLKAIAEMPAKSRGAWAPSDEELKEFNELYSKVMITKVDYDPKKVAGHCAHYLKLFTKMKTEKPALEKMITLLNTFAANTSEEELQDVEKTYQFLINRAEKYKNADPKTYADVL